MVYHDPECFTKLWVRQYCSVPANLARLSTSMMVEIHDSLVEARFALIFSRPYPSFVTKLAFNGISFSGSYSWSNYHHIFYFRLLYDKGQCIK
jgi:hypothetical protein